MKHLLRLIVLCLLSSGVYAGDLLLGQFSHHFNPCVADCAEYHMSIEQDHPHCPGRCIVRRGYYNEVHPLIGYSTGKYSVFVMKNSFDKISVVAMRQFSYDLNKYVRPYAAVGVATGYDDHLPSLGSISPVGTFGVDLHPANDKYGIIISTIPNVLVSVGFRVKIN